MGANRFLFRNKAMCFAAAVTALCSTATSRAEVRIVAIGDGSFLAVGVPQNQTYPAQLEAALRARGHHVSVTNRSVSGDTATGVLQRLDSAVPPGTDIVILKIGEHELKFYYASPDAVAANRRTIVERLHAKGVEVYRVEDPAGLIVMERGLTDAIAEHLIVEPNCSPLVACHASAAALGFAVRRTLPAIEALVGKVEKQGACRPQCASQRLGGQDREGEEREAVMLDLPLESALRSLVLGVAVWLGLALLRVRNPRAHMTAWTVVLVASLAMPVLMHRLTVIIPAAAPTLGVVESLSPRLSGPLSEQVEIPSLPAQGPLAQPPVAEPVAVQPPHPVTPDPAGRREPGWSSFDWRTLAAAVYLVVAGVMLLRLLTGLLLSWRMARAARPIHEGWTGGADVRVSDAVGMPVTFGSTVLLPAEYADWGEEKRQIVLSHERAHVAHGDFYVLLLAAFNRAVFWFNPLAWWQLVRMAELAEIISDDTVLEKLDDRPFYAGILVDLALHKATIAVAMARACTLRKRVERILAGTAVSARMGWRKRAMVAIALAPAVMFSAAAVVPGASKPSAESVAARPGAPSAVVVPGASKPPAESVAARPGARSAAVVPGASKPSAESMAARPGAPVPHANTVEGEPHPFDRYVGYFEFYPFRTLTVARGGDRLTVQETGRLKFEATARGDQTFVSQDTDETITFTSDANGRITAVLLGERGLIWRRAVRIDAERAQKIENAFARQVATAPDRFKDQLPADGTKSALLRLIHDLQLSAPGDERIGQMAENVRRQAGLFNWHAMLTGLGAVESVFFRGVGPGGYDIYGAKFANGLAEFRVRPASDSNIEDMTFRPDGDGTPGEILTCAQEQKLKAVRDTVPIQLQLFNESGADIHAFALDGDGTRLLDRMIGDDRSPPFLTQVGQPWVVTDADGQCLEIIIPGQRTRSLTIRADAHEQAGRPTPQRISPMPGSEQALRRYIDALRRGEPNYADMTPQIARYTRQELVLNRAILAKLGALRAMLFGGVTPNGNDLYIVHFANGSAEWRIGLVKQDKIGRIGVGPQY